MAETAGHDENFTLRLKPSVRAAITRAARKHMYSQSDFVRQAILVALSRDGVSPDEAQP
jgi:uncharacterized protein (DUF1778 family)